ncbi:MAG: hypothetical protein COT81_04915 [Candidatus Buchananbacteria bacterium CG10_big_fil_rev_8_21_14_0_10_42_9]|uniref:ATP:glycerol 3-phosphotransferase n=1 Tax=Candidatus Buchananbacteria bacterium CG10_big_fil_rev_8_21_14_0_10_42_9 TaxID=1974526 RepID=A0A2H0W2L0_9BACT|nr:MAG: hypothetical protein COT81_04915 [Candidatus Buchananbacteria bacterium CG10_big_fil_rev_8_21_14_0_10_42_9]
MKKSTQKSSGKHVLVLDVGTTGIKAIVFDNDLNEIAIASNPLPKREFKSHWVEQNPPDLLRISQNTLRQAVKKSQLQPNEFGGFGLTNQRETTILWDTVTRKAVYPAIVWEDKRTAKHCASLKKYQQTILHKTGLVIDPYFSATKISWILENIPAAKKLLAQKRLGFGTVDSWILWNFTQEQNHVTDYTNACRTLLFNIRTLKWDKSLLDIFEVPKTILPKIKPSKSNFGTLKKSILGFSLPVKAVIGDQQSSAYATGVKRGLTKITYGTGTFINQSIGRTFQLHQPFFTTLLPSGKKPLYAVEGKIESSASKVSKALNRPIQLNKIITEIATDVNFFVQNLPLKPKQIIVDGGITQYPDLIKIQSRISKIPVVRQITHNGTALGVAKLILDN